MNKQTRDNCFPVVRGGAGFTFLRFLMLVWVFVVFCRVVSVPAAEEETPLPEGEVPAVRDIVFVTRGEMPILAELYKPPQAANPLPGVVIVHGGGFVTGSRKYIPWERMARILTNAGFVIFNVDYRLINQGGSFPQNVWDVSCAVRWFRGHAKEYGVDPERIALLGSSAGGYLAGFVALTPDKKEFHGDCGEYNDVDPSVKAAVLIYGVFDLGAMKGNLANLLQSLFYKNLPPEFSGDIEGLKKTASPINYVDSAPPILLIHGDVDVLVPVEQSRMMYKALKDAGKEVQFFEYKGQQHGFFDETYPKPESLEAMKASLKFLKDQLAEKPKE